MNRQQLERNSQAYQFHHPQARDPPAHNEELCYLPDCVVSYIFSKLSMKHLVRTSILSKKWYNELWGLKRDLNFDSLGIFGSNKVTMHPWEHPYFVTCVDKFMLHYRSAKIGKFRLEFPLGSEHRHTLHRWITQAVAKGGETIELLLMLEEYGTNNSIIIREPYEFPCTIFSGGGSSLKHLHLQSCLLRPPIGFLGFRTLITLVLEKLLVEQNLLQCLSSNCSHLEDLTFKFCDSNCDLKIASPTLHHLKIIEFGRWRLQARHRKIDIFALNLSSLEYSGGSNNTISSLEAPNLLKCCLCRCDIPPVDFSRLNKLRTLVLECLILRQYQLLRLLSECLNLEELTIKRSRFLSDMHVISPTLHHLKIIYCHHFSEPGKIEPGKTYIDTLNLLSFDYRGESRLWSIKAPQLLKTYLDGFGARGIPRAFALMANLQHLEKVTMVMDRERIQNLPSRFGPFQHLKHLEIIVDGGYRPEMDFLWVLKIVKASPHLQKFVLKITPPGLFANQRARRKKYRRFFHNELKYVDFCGFAGNINEMELISHLLRKVNSLEQITFRCCDGRVYIGAGTWISDWKTKYRHKREQNCLHDISCIRGWKTEHWHERELEYFHGMLQGKVNEKDQVIYL